MPEADFVELRIGIFRQGLAKPPALCDDDIHPKAESPCSDLILRIA